MKRNRRLIIILFLMVFIVNIIVFSVVLWKKNNTDKAVNNILDNVNENSSDNEKKDEGKGGNGMQDTGSDSGVPGVRITLCDGFYYEPLSEELKAYITGKSYKENEKIDYSDLRHVIVKHIDFNGQEGRGELIVNVQVADDILAIFKELYDASYPIEKIRLIDEYNADDDASMTDNNSSAFNYRTIDGTGELSDHGYGIAVDINPLYNPYVRKGFGDRNVLPVNGAAYADRTADFEHKIVKGDVCYNAFISRGWKWGGEWTSTIDYQHFYKEIAK